MRKHFDTATSQADGEKQVVITRSTNIKRPPQLPATATGNLTVYQRSPAFFKWHSQESPLPTHHDGIPFSHLPLQRSPRHHPRCAYSSPQPSPRWRPSRQQNNSTSWQVTSATNVPGYGKPAAEDSPSSQEAGGNPVVEEREVHIGMDDFSGKKCEFVMTPGFLCD
jgi:hypothetical protein